MHKIVVVRHRKNRKILPFNFVGQNNEIDIIYSGGYNLDDYVVSVVDASEVDWDNMYIIDRSV